MAYDLETYKRHRQKGRTNLGWLCRQVLGYKDVSQQVHGPILDVLQQFKGGDEEVTAGSQANQFKLVQKSYKPFIPLWQLERPEAHPHRSNLILYPRGHLKTTIITFAHTIQWILNYTDVLIDLHTAIDKQAKEFLSEIKAPFISNELFRFLYPEFCPRQRTKTGKTEDFGNQEMFRVPNASFKKEPTICTFTVGSTIASGHYDVTKCDDLVDKENVRTPEQILVVKNHFSMIDPLVQRYNKPEDWPADKKWNGRGWLDLAGTIYDFSDLHYSTVEAEKEKPIEKKSWNVVLVNPAPNYPKGPTLWESRWPVEEFKKIEEDPTAGPAVLYSQYFLNPIPAKSGLVDSEDQIVFIPRGELDSLLPRLAQNVTIDLAGMEPQKKTSDNDYTVINHHGFSRDGRMYINRLWRERFTDPMQVIDLMFEIRKYYPLVRNFRISKDHFARVLMPFMTREMRKRGVFLPVTPIPIDTTVSKVQKIMGLKPWLQMKSIIWAADIPCKSQIINEIMRFPKYSHDDILDTTVDAMMNEDGSLNMEVVGRAKTAAEVHEQPSPLPQALTWAMLQQKEEQEASQYCQITGW